MVIIKKPTNAPVAGRTFSIIATEGTSPYKFRLKMNGRTKVVFQENPEIMINIPEEFAGEIRIEVEDETKSVDSCVFSIKRIL